MVIWLGFLAVSFVGGMLLWRSKPVWKVVGLILIVSGIAVYYYIGWNF